MDSFSSQLNAVLVDTFNNILKFEEDLLKHSTNIDLSINEMHLIEHVGKNKNDGKMKMLIQQPEIDTRFCLKTDTAKEN